MSLILNHAAPDASRIVNGVCDCCFMEFSGDIDIQEVVRLRLRAGYGFAWGDDNEIDLDLRDARGH